MYQTSLLSHVTLFPPRAGKVEDTGTTYKFKMQLKEGEDKESGDDPTSVTPPPDPLEAETPATPPSTPANEQAATPTIDQAMPTGVDNNTSEGDAELVKGSSTPEDAAAGGAGSAGEQEVKGQSQAAEEQQVDS